MSKQSKTNRRGHPPKSAKIKQRSSTAPFAVGAVVIAIAVGASLWPSPPPPAASPASTPTSTTIPATNTPPPAAVAAAKPDFQKLTGKWLRPDGGYIIDIKSVTDGGVMEAGYFNPKSIHVAKAEASANGAVLKVFVELRDVNYPGSTYTLAYEPESDQLKGIYYQALQQQSFEVYFVRKP